MKELKRNIALMLTVCMVLTNIVPAYADEVTTPEEPVIQQEIADIEASEIINDTEPDETASDEISYEDKTILENIEKATHANADYIETEEAQDDTDIDAFEEATPANAEYTNEKSIREIVVDGIKITLIADAGVFPEDAELWAEKVEDEATEEAIEEAVEKERDDNANVASSYKFDIKMFVNGEEVQPDTSKGSVKVTFTLTEELSKCLDANAYHLKEDAKGNLTAKNLGAEVKTVEETAEETDEEAGNTSEPMNTVGTDEDGVLEDGVIEDDITDKVTKIEAETDGFSYYVVEFTYNELQYVLPGDSSVKLSEILKTLAIEGTVSEAEVSSPELFTVEKDTEGDDWTVTALQAFSTEEWMKVTIDAQVYEIIVTDEQNGQDPVPYFDWDDTTKQLVEKQCTGYTVIDSNIVELEPEGGYVFDADKWYVFRGEVVFNNRIIVERYSGTTTYSVPTRWILTDGSSINATKGIFTKPQANLSIYGQENGSGSLTASADYAYPGIGGSDTIIGGGTLIINGGTITATGGARAPGIDGDYSVTINGGTVTATGGSLAAGIGGRYEKRGGTTAGHITINGGTVIATGTGASGIGYGYDCRMKSGTINISGGTVTAYGGLGGNNITINEDMLIYAGRSRESASRSDKSGIGSKYVLIDAGVNYNVRHMTQAIDDPTKYELKDPETLSGSPGFKTEAVARVYSGFSAQPITQKEISADGTTTVDVKYNRNTYTIRFDTRGICAEPESIQAGYGLTVQVDPGTLSAPGYVFDKWYKDSECIEEFTVPQDVTMPDHDITIYAGWTPKTDTPYKVYHYYENPDGSGEISLEIEEKTGTTGEYTAAEVKNKSGLRIRPFTQKLIEGDGSTIVTIYYGLNIYTITFNANGHGTAPEPIMATPGTVITEPKEKSSAEGYIFEGWYTEAECTNKFIFSTMPLEDKTLYAKWTPIKYTITWKDGAKVLRTDKVAYDTMPDYGSDPVKQGYEFLHWWPTVQKVTGDATYNAIFFKQLEQYTITWKDWDGKILATTTIDEGSLPKYPGASKPSRSGYIFTGWTPEIDLATSDKTYTATYEKKSSGGGGGGGSGSGGGGGSAVIAYTEKPAVTPITVAANGSQMMGTAVVSIPAAQLAKSGLAPAPGIWSKANGMWAYTKTDGNKAKNEWVLITVAGGNASYFYFDSNSNMVTGWQQVGGKWMYFNNESGSLLGACLRGPGRTPDGYEIDASGAWTGR